MNKISVVVPCFNMIDTIATTLESIWRQNEINLELIVIDGLSTDGTKQYLKDNEARIDILISEKDKGQYDAIQKGMSMASGDVLCWLNADDIYFPWTLKIVSEIFTNYTDVNWIAGIPSFLDANGVITNLYNTISARPRRIIANGGFRENVFGYLQQESMFWRKEVWDKVDGIDLELKLAADFDLWRRFANHYSLTSIGLPLAGFRVHEGSRSKLLRNDYNTEVANIVNNLKVSYNFISKVSSKSNVINKLVRLLYWRKVDLIYYSVSKKKWQRCSRFRPLSNISTTQLMLEI